MRIAQVAPPFESVPPARYGGTERVISTLTEELVRRGHEVTLFASGDPGPPPVLSLPWGGRFGTRRHGSRTLLRTGRSRSVISDQRFLRLIQNLLNAGYLENWQYQRTLSGTPQGGILTPPAMWQTRCRDPG
jgi:glycosyltransferase involved in cell wall biosynthesis